MNTKDLPNQINRQLWVGPLTPTEKLDVTTASKILGLRKSEFYRRAIIEKAQSVISSIESNEEASSTCEEQEDGAFSHIKGEA